MNQLPWWALGTAFRPWVEMITTEGPANPTLVGTGGQGQPYTGLLVGLPWTKSMQELVHLS